MTIPRQTPTALLAVMVLSFVLIFATSPAALADGAVTIQKSGNLIICKHNGSTEASNTPENLSPACQKALKGLPATTPHPKATTPKTAPMKHHPNDTHDQVLEVYNNLIDVGLLKSLKLDFTYTAYIDSKVWHTLPPATQKGAAVALATYVFKYRNNIKQITLLDYTTHKELATYSDIWGYQNKE